jgi:16S rRNA (guanine966-N2)-methyltransferase
VLQAPAGRATRPTADRVREALFNILLHGQPELVGASVLDAFAGSGALGLEALSRGAGHAIFLDTDRAAIAAMTANAAKLGVSGQCTILRQDATRPGPAERPCRIILMDPPYRSGLAEPALRALDDLGWMAPDALVVIEVAADEAFAAPTKGHAIADQRTYGAARLVFLRPAGSP